LTLDYFAFYWLKGIVPWPCFLCLVAILSAGKQVLLDVLSYGHRICFCRFIHEKLGLLMKLNLLMSANKCLNESICVCILCLLGISER